MFPHLISPLLEDHVTDRQKNPESKSTNASDKGSLEDLDPRSADAGDADNVRGGSTDSLIKSGDIEGESPSKGHKDWIQI